MKKHLHLFLVIPLVIGFGTFKSKVIKAQELKVVSFKYLEGNTTARVNRRRDVNGQNCAVVIIKHNFNDFTVEAGKDYEHLEEKTGETWVWLSPDEYQLVIRKKTGYIPLQIPLKDELKELETYVTAYNKHLREAVKTMNWIILLRNSHPVYRGNYAKECYKKVSGDNRS